MTEVYRTGDFLVRNVLGIEARTRALAVSTRLEAGWTVQFHLRDAHTSSEDLERHLEATVERLEQRLGEPYDAASAATAQQRLEVLVRQLPGSRIDDADLRALTLCWCDVYLRRFPVPERAEKALCRYARGSGIDLPDLEAQLSEYCADEFKRRYEGRFAYWGSRIGAEFGEPFRVDRMVPLDDPVAAFRKRGQTVL